MLKLNENKTLASVLFFVPHLYQLSPQCRTILFRNTRSSLFKAPFSDSAAERASRYGSAGIASSPLRMYGLQGKSERIILHDRTEHLAVMPSFLSAVSHICQSLGFPTTLKDGKWRGRGDCGRIHVRCCGSSGLQCVPSV